MTSAFGVEHLVTKSVGDRAAKAYLTGKASLQAGKLRRLAGQDAVNQVTRAALSKPESAGKSITLLRKPTRSKKA